jgi:hypothetical protein
MIKVFAQDIDDEARDFLESAAKEHAERSFFIEQKLGSEIHWLFTQAAQALKHKLYLPACTSFLNGIEASLRVTLAQIEEPSRVKELPPEKTLSNRLLKSAVDVGLPVTALAFPGEGDFLEKLESQTPERINVEVVRIRHNLCHGNILEYVNTELGEDSAFFTPECCRELAHILHNISKEWAVALGAFRRDHLGVT